MHMSGCVSNIHIYERVYNMDVIIVAGICVNEVCVYV